MFEPMSAEPARLPVSVTPVDGEAIDSYLERLADANGMTFSVLSRRVRFGGARTAFLAIAPDEQLVGNLATLSTVPTIELERGTANALPGINADGLDPASKKTWRTVAARGWPPEHGSALCAACLAADGAWRLAWRHPWVTACVRHRLWLVNTCPACRHRFRSHRTPLRPVDAPAGTCGNPGGARGRNCPQPLAELRGEPAASEVLLSQQRIDAAVAGQRVVVLDEMVEASAYLLELKALTVLLLHLAVQPGGDSLAGWAAAARADRTRSAGDRGARWGLAPPADLHLRGLAIATADAILRAPDVEAAAEALHPWTGLTPPTNDGQLGWLADHTTMTSALTRLVMRATAARRRIATLLDHPPTCGVPATAIPQVLPADLYATRLGGLLDVGDRTGRLFTSICLARRHTAARTWADVAIALGLHAETGPRTARASSANVVVRPDVFVRVLDDLAEQLDAGADYRSREAVARRLASKTTWYRRWARTHHPGSHATSRGYAVTWLWTEYAHGHIDTSPGWQRPPDHTDRARFHRYASRLSPAATTALIEIATTTASTPTRRTA
jgi:hypothetical protein